MTNADAIIVALRAGHDSLAELVLKLSDDDLALPSGAAEWDISQVLSHLGSGAEIGRAVVQAALDGGPNPGGDFNASVWDRWNAMSRRERADGFLQSNQTLTALYESMDADTRENVRINMGFLPAPVDVATAARLRLNELALHSWDVRVGFDVHAILAPEATDALLHGAPDLLGWISKPDLLNGEYQVIRVTTSRPDSVFALRLNTQVSTDFDVPQEIDGTLQLPAESWLRLVAGRLAPQHTAGEVVSTGAVDLDLLRRVLPGY